MRFVLLLAFACASDDTYTWRDASADWSASWCAFAERCHHDAYVKHGGDRWCVYNVTSVACSTGKFDCDQAYPFAVDLVKSCVRQMPDLACEAERFPEVCYDAF